MRTKIIAAVLFVIASSGAQASDFKRVTPVAATSGACAMTYATFEYAVPHVEVGCPKGMSMGEATFCRASIANDALHVYMFRNNELQCLLDLRSYDEGAFDLTPH